MPANKRSSLGRRSNQVKRIRSAQSSSQGKGGMFFIVAPGGTGKTFLVNLLLATVRQRSQIALAVASCGIAATLLDGGRTAHSAFKLPIDLANKETPTCNIGRGTGKAALLNKSKLIIWDEATMSHKRAFEALDRTLKDIRCSDELMGGTTVVLSGDFRQTLPVIARGTRADAVNACLKSSTLWNQVQKLHLSTNMRVHLHESHEAGKFAQMLLDVGNGLTPIVTVDGQVKLPFGQHVDTEEQLLWSVFPNIHEHIHDHRWLSERAILAPKNDIVNVMNGELLDILCGETTSYKALDTMVDDEEAVQYPTEFLNSLQPPGVPPYNLQLKKGVPIILLRNLDPPRLCNGTRLAIKQMFSHVLEATIIAGKGKGENVFIPRIPIIPSDSTIEFKRLQFPIRLSFSMTINKSQGQTLQVVGLNLKDAVFSHGQLYVGCSRVRDGCNLHIYSPINGHTKNVVYNEALN